MYRKINLNRLNSIWGVARSKSLESVLLLFLCPDYAHYLLCFVLFYFPMVSGFRRDDQTTRPVASRVRTLVPS